MQWKAERSRAVVQNIWVREFERQAVCNEMPIGRGRREIPCQRGGRKTLLTPDSALTVGGVATTIGVTTGTT